VPRTMEAEPGPSLKAAELASAVAQYEYDPGLAGGPTRTKGTHSHPLLHRIPLQQYS
jgi:hypothetical protein